MTQQGSIITRKRKGGGKSFVIQYRDHDGKQCAETVRDSLKAAKTRRDEILEGLERNQNPLNSASTVSEWGEWWLSTCNCGKRASTVSRYRQHLAHIYKVFGDTPLRDLNSVELQDLYAGLCDAGLSTRTVNAIFGTFSTMLSRAVSSGALKGNPVDDIDRAKVDKGKPKALSPAQLKTLLAALENRNPGPSAEARFMYAIVTLAAFTGMRRGEIIGLTWGDVNLNAQILSVEHSKTDNGLRNVRLDTHLVGVLKDHRCELEFASASAGRDDRPVFPDVNGERLSRRFSECAKRYGMPKGCTLHWLRHTHATVLLNEGVDPSAVADRLGHSDPSVTYKTYSHVMTGQQEAAAQVMGAVLGSE